jgi:membrane protein required for colicin V production
MNYLDMFIMVLLIWAVYRGYSRGFMMQFTTIVALAAGLFLAVKLSGWVSELLENHINIHPESVYLVSLSVTFVLVFIGVHILGDTIENRVEASSLSILNRVMGIFFSVFKIVLICGVVLAYMNRFDVHARILPQNSREHSLFYNSFTKLATAIFPALKTEESNARKNLVLTPQNINER